MDITVSFWANFDQLDSSSDDTIISTNGNPIGVEHDASYAWQTFTVVDGSTYFANTTENMDIDEWVHIASTYDGERLCIYITGESKDCNTSPSGDPTNENINIHIGSDDNDAENIDGKLDDIRIYNRSISNNEVDKLYNSRNKNHAINGCRLVS